MDSGVGELVEDGEVGGADLEVEVDSLGHACWSDRMGQGGTPLART